MKKSRFKPRFSIHFSFLLMLVGSFFVGLGPLMLGYFFCLILHEVCHAICAKRLGYRIGKIKLLATGAALEAEDDEFSYADEIKIALAGPLFNLCLALVIMVFWWLFPESYNYTQDFFVINMAIFCFNLLPSFPLDGGRILLASLSKKTDRKVAVMVCRSITICLSLFMFFLFIISLFISPNFSLGAVSITLFISGITEEKSAVYHRNFMSERKKERAKKRGIEIRQVLVSKDASDFQLLRQLSARFYTIFVVVDDNFMPLRTISETELIKRLTKPGGD